MEWEGGDGTLEEIWIVLLGAASLDSGSEVAADIGRLPQKRSDESILSPLPFDWASFG